MQKGDGMTRNQQTVVLSALTLATVALAVWRVGAKEPFLGSEPRKGFDHRRVSYAKPALVATAVIEVPELKFAATNHDVIEDVKRHEFILGDVVQLQGTIAFDDPKDAPIGVSIEIFEPTTDGRRKYGSAGGGVCKIQIKQSDYSFKVPMPDEPGKYSYEFRCGHPSNLAKGKLLQRGQILVRAFK